MKFAIYHKGVFNVNYVKQKGVDDNLWIFPMNYLDIFENSVDSLIAENKITHEINHKIINFGGQINYIDKLIDSYMAVQFFLL